MFWIGIALLVVGLVWAAFKGYVVWDIAHDPYNGGGSPTLDFALFPPALLATGGTLVLKELELYPFPWFGLIAYLVAAVFFAFLLWLFHRIGEPKRKRQLDAIKRDQASESESRTEK